MLWTKQLVKLYQFTFSLLLIFVSYHCNRLILSHLAVVLSAPFWVIVSGELDMLLHGRIPAVLYFIGNLALQSVLASCYLTITSGPSTPFWVVAEGFVVLSFVLPSLTAIFPMEYHAAGPMWYFLAVVILHVSVVVLHNIPRVSYFYALP